ncbi:MAG TPA: RagB/SusD family nutrient uptake outer membrane protein [Flavitalea sp.]|nr:RagB/SusD family nutrient uptake outer membrane protein [Flavitalea sp.]
MKSPFIYRYCLIGFVVMTCIVSCRKALLEPVPSDKISDKIAFATPERILAQVHGMYQGVKDGRFLGGRGLINNDVRAEEWLNVTTNGVTAFDAWNHSLNSTSERVQQFWVFGYFAINRINVVMQGIKDNPTVIPQALATKYEAEGRFLRGVSYFYLVTLYGKKPYTFDNGASPGLPLRLQAETTPANAHLARSTVAQVYQQILADLDFAEANLPLTYGAAGDTNTVRAHRNAAIAFKTRVYLNMGKYQEVITEANKIVSANAPFQSATGRPHRLEPVFANVFRAPYTLPESIFSFPMTNTSGPGTQNGIALYHNTEYELNPAGIIGDPSFSATDARKALVQVAGGRMRYTKFNSDNDNYVPIIRYGEVLLNLAEAIARTTGGVDARAVALLNAVRQRSDPATTFTVASFATNSALIDAILKERRMELLGEGVRSMDILRLGIPIPAKGGVQAVPPDSKAYVWPIPQDELLYNNLMTTNE